MNWQSKVAKNKGKTPVYRGAQLNKYYLEEATDFVNIDSFSKESYQYQLQPKVLNQLALAHVKNPYPHFYLQAVYDDENRIVFETIACTLPKRKELNLKFIVALNNSKLFAWLLYKFIYANAIRSTRFDESYVGRLPCMNLQQVNAVPFETLVNQIIEKKANNEPTQDLENQIDLLVYQLYGLNYEEVKIIDPEIEKIISQAEYERNS